jgi:hypothetical protein
VVLTNLFGWVLFESDYRCFLFKILFMCLMVLNGFLIIFLVVFLKTLGSPNYHIF